MPDDPRRTILARRAKFLAAALATTLPAAACEKDKPKTEDPEARPQACLKTVEGPSDDKHSGKYAPVADTGAPDAKPDAK